jgi:glycine/D-amino acid oxidase-like deaminating enzyme
LISYWENRFKQQKFDITIIGAGFTGLFSALFYLKNNPKAKIAIFDKQFPPPAASTRNAGFACFGNPTELLDDLSKENPENVLSRVEMRVQGLSLLRSTIGEKKLNWTSFGGQEVFLDKQKKFYESTCERLDELNSFLHPIFNEDVYSISSADNYFQKAIHIKNEAQIDPFMAWQSLYSMVSSYSNVFFAAENVHHISGGEIAQIETDRGSYISDKTLVCTNGFSNKLPLNLNVVPARAQVLITKPINDLPIQGSFHMDEGYIYFRNVENRLLLGGARNIDFEQEQSDEFELNSKIQHRLEKVLSEFILPNHSFDIDYRWTGIMAFGRKGEKEFILDELEPNLFVATRLGGMGVALAPALAQKVVKKMG